MQKTVSTLMALVLAGVFGAVSLTANAAKHEGDAVAKACKDKKPGDIVKVDGKDVKCPEAKKK
jgi:hypothetical protein